MSVEAWYYEASKYEHRDDDFWKDIPGGTDYEKRLRELGFEDKILLTQQADEDTGSIEIHKHSTGTYMVSIWSPNREWERIHCNTFPDLLEFLRQLQPLIQAFDDSRDRKERIESIIEKAFEAWHGHSTYGNCPSCDRIGYETWMARKRQRAETTNE